MVIKAFVQTVAVIALLAALLFGSAGTVQWYGAYVLLAAFAAGGAIMIVWLAHNDPALLKERMGKRDQKKQGFDRIILPLLNIFVAAWLVAMALDVRWHGATQMPEWVSLIAGAIIVAGFFLVVRVMRENTFATSVVRAQPERGHKLIDTGPYALVRHPMYGAAAITYIAIPFALGSFAGLWGVPVPILLLAIRIRFEERLLRRELPGYRDYIVKVRYRLIPFIW